MIDIQDLLKNPTPYRESIQARNNDPKIIDELLALYKTYKGYLQKYEFLRSQQNTFSKQIGSLHADEKKMKLAEMKTLSIQVKDSQSQVDEHKRQLDFLLKKVPNRISPYTPIGKNDNDNIVIKTFGKQQQFNFTPKPYRELSIYKKYVDQEAGAKAMGARGYYLKGEIARFQKVLMDYALDYILQQGYELYYVPLMLNDKVLTGTGHLPDFDGQQYETPINENTNYYLIGSSEPSIMGGFMDEHLGDLKEPILTTCQSSCFRKESGSYGKDQQGILRVHQFEKIEMVAICRPEDIDMCYDRHVTINEYIWNSLGLHFQKVEVCSGDMPTKHYRQQDYEARFPAVQQYREIGSNGNASDFQNRGLHISYTNEKGEKRIPRGLNDTGMTFRTGLAILEQNQTADGKVKIPDVLIERFGKERLE